MTKDDAAALPLELWATVTRDRSEGPLQSLNQPSPGDCKARVELTWVRTTGRKRIGGAAARGPRCKKPEPA